MRHFTKDDMHWAGLAALAAAGALVAHFHWDYRDEWFYVGLGMVLVTATMVNTLLIQRRYRHADADIRTGQRIGYRAGRADTLAELAAQTRQHNASVRSLYRRRVGDDHGGVQATPLRAVAGDRADPRWPAEYED